MADSLDTQLSPAAREILAKRNHLVAEKEELAKRREALLAEQRRNARDLADCRAAARLFGLSLDFPPDEVEEGRVHIGVLSRDAMTGQIITHRDITRGSIPPGLVLKSEPFRAPVIQPNAILSPPPMREFALAYLMDAGDAGSRAAPIREKYERKYGVTIHEKTVGMTLYRLSKENKVRRTGQTWFFVPPEQAETENPGAVTPGPVDVFS
jgi:hypothetical protein